MSFQLLSTIRVKLVYEEMQNAYLCYFTRQAQKNTIYRDYTELHVLIWVKIRGNISFRRED